MKKLVVVILFLGLMFSLAMAEEIERVEFKVDGDYFSKITTISALKEEIVKEDSITWNIKHQLDIPNAEQYYQEAISNPGKEIVVYDSLRVIELFLPEVERTELLTWLEAQELDANLEHVKRFSWEILLFYLFSLCASFLLIFTFLSEEKKYLIFLIIFLAFFVSLIFGLIGFIPLDWGGFFLRSVFSLLGAAILIAVLLIYVLLISRGIKFYRNRINGITESDIPDYIYHIIFFSGILILIIFLTLPLPVFNRSYLLLTVSGMHIISTLITWLIMGKKIMMANTKETEEE